VDAALAALSGGGEEEAHEKRHQRAIGAADQRLFEGGGA